MTYYRKKYTPFKAFKYTGQPLDSEAIPDWVRALITLGIIKEVANMGKDKSTHKKVWSLAVQSSWTVVRYGDYIVQSSISPAQFYPKEEIPFEREFEVCDAPKV